MGRIWVNEATNKCNTPSYSVISLCVPVNIQSLVLSEAKSNQSN